VPARHASSLHASTDLAVLDVWCTCGAGHVDEEEATGFERTSYRQARVPDRLLGRVMASYRVIAYGAMPTGALLGGALASTFGLRAPFVGGVVIVVVLLVYFVPATRGEVQQA
jgi:hypothetical protein